MLQVKLPVVDRIHPQSNKFATGEENMAAGDSKLNDSPMELPLSPKTKNINITYWQPCISVKFSSRNMEAYQENITGVSVKFSAGKQLVLDRGNLQH